MTVQKKGKKSKAYTGHEITIRKEKRTLAAPFIITDQRMIALTYSQITTNACTRHLGSNSET